MDLPSIEPIYLKPEEPIQMALGFFDGPHKGHRFLVTEAKKRSPYLKLIFITFKHHPTFYLREKIVPKLSSLSQKLNYLKAWGVDEVIVLDPKVDFFKKNGSNFLLDLKKNFPQLELFIFGHDTAFGKDRRLNFSASNTLPFASIQIPPLLEDNKIITSTWIRNLILRGSIDDAEKLLGHPYLLELNLEEGHKNGRKIGFPTLNFSPEGWTLPPFGVWGAEVYNGQQKWNAILNIGKAPTLHLNRGIKIEVHTLERFTLEEHSHTTFHIRFRFFIRDEVKFRSIDDLKQQIQKDFTYASSQFEN